MSNQDRNKMWRVTKFDSEEPVEIEAFAMQSDNRTGNVYFTNRRNDIVFLNMGRFLRDCQDIQSTHV